MYQTAAPSGEGAPGRCSVTSPAVSRAAEPSILHLWCGDRRDSHVRSLRLQWQWQVSAPAPNQCWRGRCGARRCGVHRAAGCHLRSAIPRLT